MHTQNPHGMLKPHGLILMQSWQYAKQISQHSKFISHGRYQIIFKNMYICIKAMTVSFNIKFSRFTHVFDVCHLG